MQILELPNNLDIETSDYVALTIKAAVFYRIVEPEKTLVRIQNVRQQITETAVATLAGIIRASSLSDLGSRSQPFYNQKQENEEKKEIDDGGYAPEYNEIQQQNNNLSFNMFMMNLFNNYMITRWMNGGLKYKIYVLRV